MDVGAFQEARVDAQVDHVAARSHDRELDELHPVVRMPESQADPARMVARAGTAAQQGVNLGHRPSR